MSSSPDRPFSLSAFRDAEEQNSAPDKQRTVTTVTVVGGGVAGLSAACALADAGFQVTVLERRGYAGGRASSYLHPGTGEVIDNCQHVLFGCCTNLIDFYERIGVSDQIFWDSRMTMIEPGGRRSVLAPSILPAPMHGLPGILRSSCFSFKDKLSLMVAFGSILLGGKPDPKESLLHWLEGRLQSKGAMNRFWQLVIASALNADLNQISLPLATKVIRQIFLNTANGGAMGMSRLPLSDLYGRTQDYLQARRSGIQFNANVESAAWDAEKRVWTIEARGEKYSSEMLILALPFEATAKLMPTLPVNQEAERLAAQMKSLQHWPICSVHLWFDREITELDHAVLLDSDIHWMYHKSRWQPQRGSDRSYIELVISASREFATLTREQALERAMTQLAWFFPEVKQAKLLKSAFIKEVRATANVPPEAYFVAPGAQSPWPNCFLAGDWTGTGWASTMESAARSGNVAAEALCRSLGDKRSFLIPDLPPAVLMNLFS